MYARTIKKAIGLFVVYSILIIGIFVIQFSNDSIISEKIGALQITLSETMDSDNNPVLKNSLQISFNGLNFSCDDSKPAFIVNKDSMVKEPVKLIAWEKSDALSYKFDFTNDVSFKISLSDETEKAGLSFAVELPSAVEDFYLPYTLASNTEISKQTSNRLLIGMKKESWEFLAPSLQDQYLHFNSIGTVASYSYYEESVEFKFNLLVDSSVSNDYAKSIRAFKENIISSFKSNTAEALANEYAVVAYVAEQAQRGNYASVIDEIPQSFKRGTNRTYLSAPYFNTLSDMNDNLEEELKSKESLIRRTADTYSLNIFTIRDIANYLYIYPNSMTARRILENAGEANIQNASLAECAGLLRTYVEMNKLSKAFATHLEPALVDCVAKIEKACKMEGSNLTISENGTFLSVVQAIEIGDALKRYGEYIGESSIITGGKALIASYLGESSSFDIRTLSDLYPVVVRDNTYYPHFVKIRTANDVVTWAWTVARDITAEAGEDRSITFTIDFPLEYTHYVIIRGVQSFRSIYIYDMAFRTDPRFETYNSSGYVYKNDTSALLLKSRHRSEKEIIRLVYSAPSAPKPESTEETPAVTEETAATGESTAAPSESPAPESESPAETPAESQPAQPQTPPPVNPAARGRPPTPPQYQGYPGAPGNN